VVVGQTAASESVPSSIVGWLGISLPFKFMALRDTSSRGVARVCSGDATISAPSSVVARLGISLPVNSGVTRDTTSSVVARVGTGGDTTIPSSGVAWVDTSSPLPFKFRVIGDDWDLFLVGQVYALTRSRRVGVFTLFFGIVRVGVFKWFNIGAFAPFNVGGVGVITAFGLGWIVALTFTANWDVPRQCGVL
jgi:hypothetical protein